MAIGEISPLPAPSHLKYGNLQFGICNFQVNTNTGRQDTYPGINPVSTLEMIKAALIRRSYIKALY